MRGRTGDVCLRAVAFPIGCGRRVSVDGRGRVPGVGFAGCVPAAGGCFRRRRSSWGGNGSFRSRRDGVACGRGRRLDGFGAGRGTAVTGWRGAVWLVSVPVERELVWGRGPLKRAGGRRRFARVRMRLLPPSGAGGGVWLKGLGGVVPVCWFPGLRPGRGGWFAIGGGGFPGGGIRLLPFSAGRCCLWLRMGPPLGWVWGRARDGGYGMVPVGSGTGRGGRLGRGSVDMGGRAEDVCLRADVVPIGCGRRVLVGGLGRVPGVGFAGCVRGGRALSAAAVFRGVGSVRFRWGGESAVRVSGRRLDGAGRGTVGSGTGRGGRLGAGVR